MKVKASELKAYFQDKTLVELRETAKSIGLKTNGKRKTQIVEELEKTVLAEHKRRQREALASNS